MSYADHLAADRRLCILRALADVPEYEANSSVLQMALSDYAHNVSRDLVHTDIAWLVEQGLACSRDIATVKVITLTQRGIDVAKGRAVIPGVKRPGPGA